MPPHYLYYQIKHLNTKNAYIFINIKRYFFFWADGRGGFFFSPVLPILPHTHALILT